MLDGNEILKSVSAYKNSLVDSLKANGPQTINIEEDEKLKAWQYVLSLLINGKYVYWDISIMAAAFSGSNHFIGTVFPVCSPPIQIWVQSLYGQLLSQKSGNQIIAQIIDRRGGGLSIWEVELIRQNQIQVSPRAIVHNDTEAIRDGVLAQIAAGLEFMNQPFVESVELDRVAIFSGAHIQQKRNDAKKINVVYLRRREQHPTLSDGSPNPVDWSCQWLVRGHWRNQYHPSDGSHKPTFIQSYVKGPDDKPFRTSPGTIFAAVR